MYPPGFSTYVAAPKLAENLCGKSRPGHFQGVLTVVLKLLTILIPDRAYFGLKDAQQFFILRRMAEDLNLDLAMVPCPTVREPSGLALSSRNAYLSDEEKRAALCLSVALNRAENLLKAGEIKAAAIVSAIKEIVAAEPLATLEYAEMVETEGLSLVDEAKGETLVAMAVRVGQTRLIDNFIWKGEEIN
jgi:pantoate--beta-alanine ligase